MTAAFSGSRLASRTSRQRPRPPRAPARAFGVLACILLAVAAVPALVALRTAAAYSPHPPILIAGDADFTPANGVTRGSGASADPYIIEGWEIDAAPVNSTATSGIEIGGTTAHFVIRDVYVHSAAGRGGIELHNLSNGTVEKSVARGNEFGISLVSTTRVTVMGNNVSYSVQDGIRVESSPGVSIAENNLTMNGKAIRVLTSDKVSLDGNRVFHNNLGIVLEYSTNATLTSNDLLDDGLTVRGSTVSEFASHTVPPSNLVGGAPLLYYHDCAGLGVDGVPAGQVFVANCTDVRVANLTIGPADVGIFLAYVDRASVLWNTVAGARAAAVSALSSANLTIRENFVTDSPSDGIRLEKVALSQVAANSVDYAGYGVSVVQSNRTVVTSNVLTNSLYGVWLRVSSNVTVSLNAISRDFGPGYAGVRADFGRDSEISNNSISNQTYGASLFQAISDTVHHNCLVNNTVQGEDVGGLPSSTWDSGYPSGGNYWSDYTGTDTMRGPNQNIPGSDGIGDTPVVLDLDTRDRYPLMSPGCSKPSARPPTVLSTASPDPAAPAESVRIFARILAGAGAVEEAWANVWDPWGAPVGNFSMAAGGSPGEYAFVRTYPSLGRYNYTVWAGNTRGLWDSHRGTFAITSSPDASAPVVADNHLDGLFSRTVPAGASVALIASVDDLGRGNSTITGAWYTVDGGPARPLRPYDGAFDSAFEVVVAVIDTTAWAPGRHSVCESGRDLRNNTGTAAYCNVLITSVPPGRPTVDPVRPRGGEAWTGGAAMDVSWSAADAETPPQGLTFYVNYTSSAGSGLVAGPVTGLPGPPFHVPWTVPRVNASDVVLNVTVIDGSGQRAWALATIAIDSTAPTVVSSIPANGGRDVPLGDDIRFEFDGPVNRSSAERAFAIVPDPGGVTFRWETSGTHDVLIVGHDPFREGTDYALRLNETLRDGSDPGNPLTTPVVVGFRTTTLGHPDGGAWVPVLIALVTAAGLAGTEVGRVGILTLFVAAVRGKREDEGDGENRGMIRGYIRVHPGDTYTDIKRNLALKDGTLAWHLLKLEKSGVIRSRVRGTRREYYPTEAAFPPDDGGPLHAVQQRLLAAVLEGPGAPVRVLGEACGVSSQLALYHLRILSRRGFVSLRRKGFRLLAFPGSNEAPFREDRGRDSGNP